MRIRDGAETQKPRSCHTCATSSSEGVPAVYAQLVAPLCASRGTSRSRGDAFYCINTYQRTLFRAGLACGVSSGGPSGSGERPPPATDLK
jgi:hypothetical protein